MYPLSFRPIYKEKIWGGEKLRTYFGREIPAGSKVGESWEISDHGADVSIIADGPWAGKSLRECMREAPGEVLGTAIASRSRDRFPLLVKLIDASDRLSVQVHPGDGYAALNEAGELGKTEMWYVVQADGGAELICGLAAGVDREGFKRAVEGGEIGNCLRRQGVKAGDVVFVPAGRVHAIGAGNLILEIQQNSDVTYRVYDWDRVGKDGRPRDLHLEKALEVIDFGNQADALVGKIWEEGDGFRKAILADCRYFRTAQVDVSGEWGGACEGDRFRILSFVKGGGLLDCGGGREGIEAGAGDNFLLPAALGRFVVRARPGGCTLIQTEVP